MMNSTRRYGDTGTASIFASFKSRSSPYLSIGLVVGALLLMVYLYNGSGDSGRFKETISKVEGDYSCTVEVQRAIPIWKKAMAVEPYDIEDADGICKGLVRKGLVRVAGIKFSLAYRPKSFYVVIILDALDYLSPRYLNNMLPDLARVSAEGIIILIGSLGWQRAKVAEVSKFGKVVSDC
ncbi:hypothetical protein Patl1_08770 [Pistacia atlantica]|uniref:Uncharacterized protein n=1 Tax=Pistacia atlantica TaxID=434234 RepID=A0ACC1ALL6_9ROSI|nr:hypothetical protein Patl1_08770 [Pistacia atlantica]